MIQCPTCHSENRPGANFCKRCGAVLATHCPRCATALPTAALFCDHCGVRLLEPADRVWNSQDTGPHPPAPARETVPLEKEKHPLPANAPPPQSALHQFIPPELMSRLQLATGRDAMVGERRIVTILFCDTVGSTAAAEQLDPEEWTDIINGAFEHMIRPIYKYEGTVARLMGDGLLAFFGAPIAHEDDPHRAIFAGLEIVQSIAAYARDVAERWNLGFDVRVGINTGRVVVGSVGSDLRMEYTAIGDAINVAARMEQSAAPGSVQVAQATYRLAETHFEFEPLGPISLKGKETAQPAYRVLGPRHEPVRRRGPAGLQAPLLGRDAELQRLRQAAALTSQGVGQIAFVIGEAGLGKSRLLDELRRENQEHSGSSSPLRWIEAAGAAHESARPFALLRTLLAVLTGALPGAPAADLRERLLTQIEVQQRDESEQVLGVLLGLGADQLGDDALSAADGFRRRLAATVTALITGAAQQRALVLALDDGQWADAASVDLLHHLLPLAGTLPLFFLISMRPERQAPAWRLRQEAEAAHAYRTTIVNVRPLPPDHSERLISSLFAQNNLPSAVRQLILDKAEGNPFFVEEVIRSLLDRGLVEAAADGLHWRDDANPAQIIIPDSLQSLLTARIDRLPDETRYTLQLAAVIGRSFAYRILQQVSDIGEALPGQLEDLLRRTVIHEAARLPELQYAFHHALMQEAAYRSILLRQRRAYHLRIAEAIEQLFAGRLEEFALPLAHHFYEAGDARAYAYYRLAGDAAMRLFASVEAAAHYGMAIRCGRDGAASDAELLLLYRRRGRALELQSLYEEALQNYRELAEVAGARHSQPMRVAALVGQARQRVTANPVTDLDAGRALLEEALPLARTLDDRESEATIMWLQILLLAFDEEREQQQAVAERGLALARELGLKELEAFILHDMWYLFGSLGRWRDMQESLERARALWLELDNLPMLAASLVRIHFVQSYRGQYAQALSTAEEAYALSLEGRDIEGQVLSRSLLGAVHMLVGRVDLAISEMQGTLALAESIGNVTGLSLAPAFLGWSQAFCGDGQQGVAWAQRAVEFALHNFPTIAPLPQAILVRVHLLNDDVVAAARTLAQMGQYETVRRRIGFLAVAWLMAMLATAETALAENRPQDALAVTQEFLERCKAQDLHLLLPDALLVHAQALTALDLPQDALTALQNGLAEAETQAARGVQWQLLAALAAHAAAQGDAAHAEALRQRTRDEIRFLADHTGGDALRRSFLARAPVRKLL